MKNRILLVAIFAIPVGLFVYFWFFPVSEKKSAAPENKMSQNAAVAGARAKQDSNTVAIIHSNFARVQPPPENLASAAAGKIPLAPAGQPSPLQFTNFAPATVLQNVSRAVRQYGKMFGGNPVGTNPEITAALNGNNPRRINFLNAEAGMRMNENGELVDPWGTPYFFHQLSGTDMEIHSAGPDKIMWTPDDVVAK
jgi:hypothetical protein